MPPLLESWFDKLTMSGWRDFAQALGLCALCFHKPVIVDDPNGAGTGSPLRDVRGPLLRYY